MAEVTVLPPGDKELSLRQHLDLVPQVYPTCEGPAEKGSSHLWMMAQNVSNQPTPPDRKRVKVYELRDNDWDDKGTGFCTVICGRVNIKPHHDLTAFR